MTRNAVKKMNEEYFPEEWNPESLREAMRNQPSLKDILKTKIKSLRRQSVERDADFI